MVLWLAIAIISVLVGLVLLRTYRARSWNCCRNSVNLEGKVVLITGANSGIGYEVAKELAKRKATIIFACRNLDRANQSMDLIKKSLKNCCNLVVKQLDLTSLKSIRQFAAEIQSKYPKIDILINNAGVYLPVDKLVKTDDGFESHFGINHLGHFLLTMLLLNNLKKAAPSRVVVVSSILHEYVKHFDVEDLNLMEMRKRTLTLSEQLINPAYCKSKLENAYFVREMAHQFKDCGVNFYTVCPGLTYTALFREIHKWYHFILLALVAFWFLRTTKQGAQCVIYCATEPKLINESGLFYRNCAQYQSSYKFEPKVQSRLWEKSMELVGLKTKQN